MGDTAPFWNFSAASYPDLEKNIPIGTLLGNTKQKLDGPSITSGVYLNNHQLFGILILLFMHVLYTISCFIQLTILYLAGL